MKSGLDENSMVPVFVVGRDLHLHYPLESLPSRSPLAPIRDRQHRTSHKNEIHHILAETTRRATVAGVASYGGERNNNDAKRRKGGDNKTIRYNYNHVVSFQDCCLLISTPRHNYMLLPPSPASAIGDLNFSSYFNSGLKYQDPEKKRPHYSYPLLIFASLFILENVKKVNNVKTFYCFNK